jgi:Uncharacterized conserved protein
MYAFMAKKWYNYNYSKTELQRWAKNIKSLKSKTVYVYFNNDVKAHSVGNCKVLSELLK